MKSFWDVPDGTGQAFCQITGCWLLGDLRTLPASDGTGLTLALCDDHLAEVNAKIELRRARIMDVQRRVAEARN